MSDIRFRVTDEQGWVHEFDVSSADHVVVGVRAAWDRRISETRPDLGHPGMAHRVRLGQIAAWLAEREARLGATSEQRKSWTSQAQYWRYVADRDLGAVERLSPLRIHVQCDSGTWCTIAHVADVGALKFGGAVVSGARLHPIAHQVARTVAREDAERLYVGALVVIQHERNILGLAGDVSETIRQVQYPGPALVPDSGDDS